jgi:putative exosortase-associated protein (TIGR04073 family)
MMKKAIRGGQNLTFGLLTDVPRTMYYESREHGPLLGVPFGLFKGMGLGLVRTGVGAYELLTFPLPVNDYEPVVLPALPFEPGPTEIFPDVP